MKYLLHPIIAGLLFASLPSMMSAQELTLHSEIIGFVNADLESVMDRLFITVSNTSGEEQQVHFVASLRGVSGEASDLRANNLLAEPSLVRVPTTGLMMTLRQLIEIYQNTTLEDYTILTQALRDRLLLDRKLPQGQYQFCLEARDYFTDELRSLPAEENCTFFDIEYLRPPVIQSPGQGAWMPVNDHDEIIVMWNMADYRPGITFLLEIIRFPTYQMAILFEQQGRPDDVFEAYAPILHEEDITSFTFSSFQADFPVEVQPGDFLAARVTAISEMHGLLNAGRSEIISFAYGVPEGAECNNPPISAQIVYPSPGDTIPFTMPYVMVHLEPECQNILATRNRLIARARQDGVENFNTGEIVYEYDYREAPGPSAWLRQYINAYFPSRLDYYYPAGSDRAGDITFRLGHPDVGLIPRGSSFIAIGASNVDVLNLNTGAEVTRSINYNDFSEQSAVIGMPVPRLMLPEAGDTIRPGEIIFHFNTGNAPSHLLPAYKGYVKAEGSRPVVLPLQTYEKCVLQVSSDINFEPEHIVACKLKKIQANGVNTGESFNVDNPVFESFSLTYDEAAGLATDPHHFMDLVYRNLNTPVSITENDTFFWRVAWLRHPDDIEVTDPLAAGIVITDDMLYHPSEIRRLIIDPSGESGNGTIHPESSDPSDPSACSAPCAFPTITDNEPIRGPRRGEVFTAAGLTITVTSDNGNVDALTGEGTVRLPWLNNINLEVELSDVRTNAAGQMVRGEITVVKDDDFPFSERIHSAGDAMGMHPEAARAMEAMIVGGNKFARMMASGETTTLPLGIDRVIDEQTIIVGIPHMEIKKDTAFMHIVVNLELPELEVASGFLSLGAKVCVTNSGFGQDVKLFLPRDQIFPLAGGNDFIIEGAEDQSNDALITSVEFDCNGFQYLNLVGAVAFSRDLLLPELPSGEIDSVPEHRVRGTIRVRLDRGLNALIQLNMDRFQVPGVENWSFAAEGVFLDLSDRSNPENLSRNLPAGYRHSAFDTPGMTNTWKGFFIDNIRIWTPRALADEHSNRLSFAVRGLIIDPNVSFNFNVENIAEWTETDESSTFNGWFASLDTVRFTMIQNIPTRLGFAGRIGLPIAERTQYVKYSADLMHRDGEFNLVIQAKPAGNLNIPIAVALATITTNSYLKASIGDTNYIELNLCATLGLSDGHAPRRRADGQDAMAVSFELPSIAVENLRVNTKDGFIESEFAYSLDGGATWQGEGAARARTGRRSDDDDEDDRRPGESEQESNMGGFPIGLRSFGFANDKVSIEPYITLSNGGSGISASAKIDVLISFGEDFKEFNVTGIELKKICLNVMTSDVKIAGCVEFYKDSDMEVGGITGKSEGVRGGITMEFNVGTKIGLDINANFGTFKALTGVTEHGTPQWFDYFYVDGMAYLSQGITIMSGVSLFGLGGGFWHHMSLNEARLPAGAALATMTEDQRPRNEDDDDDDSPPDEASFRTYSPDDDVHARYSPDFNTALGLKFTVILGSNDAGKAYNLDATLSATFSGSGGLTSIGINGHFRVMSEGISIEALQGRSKDPLSGGFGVNLSMPAEGEFTFSGYFNLKVRVPYEGPFIQGIGDDYYAVRAEFLVNHTGYWYFYMGKPYPGQYCGLKLQLGDMDPIAELRSYLMVGNGIPLTMPEPHELFLNIFREAEGQVQQVRSPDGDPTTLFGGQPREDADVAATGDGFAIGMSFAINIPPVPMPPFYFDLNSVIGFDVNVTRDPTGTRRCSASGIIPGEFNNRWYATGQVYAGIRATFGLGIPYFVPDLKIEIFRGSAAIIMRGGLLGPDWFAGRGALSYDVAGHRGTCNFRAEIGDVCMPTMSNPLAGVKLIDDVTPDQSETDVSVYSDISVGFSVGMEREYEFPEMVAPEEAPVIRVFRPYIKYFRVVPGRSASGAGLPLESFMWSQENRVLTTRTANPLGSNAHHTIYLECRVREIKSNGVEVDVTTGESSSTPFRQDTTVTFRTAAEPDKLSDEIIDFTYPYIRQQNFLKGETDAGKGYIRTIYRGNRCLTELKTVSIGLGDLRVIEKYIMRFSSRHDTIQTPAQVFDGGRGVSFDVSRLHNNTVYYAQLLRVPIPESEMSADLRAYIKTQGYTGPGSAGAMAAGAMLVNRETIVTGDGSTINLDLVKEVQLPRGRVLVGEKELYGYYFKTSEYNTFEMKMQASSASWEPATLQILTFDNTTLSADMDEDFEWIDQHGYKGPARGGASRTIYPAVEFGMNGDRTIMGDLFNPAFVINPYLLNQVRTLTYDRMAAAIQMRHAIASRPFEGRDISAFVPALGQIEFYGYFANAIGFSTSPAAGIHYGLGPLSDATLAEHFTFDLGTAGNIQPVGAGMIPGLNSPSGNLGLTGPASPTHLARIRYTVHFNAFGGYMLMQRALRNFSLSRISGSDHVVRDAMLDHERRHFDNIISKSIADVRNITRPTPGVRHQFTMRYRYPDITGIQRSGSRFHLGFTY